jgi:hypothetical protein
VEGCALQSLGPTCDVSEVLPACQGANVDAPHREGSVAGGVTVGIRMLAESNLNIQGLQLFTGEKAGGSTLEVWSHDETANAPKEMLASGRWIVGEPLEWQGPNFEASVPVVSGALYWVVWRQLDRAHSLHCGPERLRVGRPSLPAQLRRRKHLGRCLRRPIPGPGALLRVARLGVARLLPLQATLR